MKRDDDTPDLVRGRADVQVNQTGSGPMADKRTKRTRDRSTRERKAREASEDEQ